MSNPTVPLSLVAAELDTSADDLANQFADDVMVDDVTGLRSIPAEVCRVFLADRRAAQQAEQDRRAAERAEAARTPHPERERVAALQAQQERDGGYTGTIAPYLGGVR